MTLFLFFIFDKISRDGSIRYWKIKSRSKENYLQQLKIQSDVFKNPIINIDATPQHIVASFFGGSIKVRFKKIAIMLS